MTSSSAASIVRPCLERMHQAAAGRKYSKLRQDAEALLEKLDTLLQVQQAAVTLQPTSPAAAAASLAYLSEAPLPASAGGAGHEQQQRRRQEQQWQQQQQQLEVCLKEGEDGQIRFTLSPSKHGSGGEEDADHMPSHPPLQLIQQTQQSGMAVAMGRQWEPEPLRPGALVEGAARELLGFLHDVIDTRKPAMLEVALDCIQKLISFKLLQGPVHSIQHRRDAASSSDAVAAAPVSQRQQQDEHSDEPAVAPAAIDFDSLPPQVQAVELLCCCDDVSDEAVELRLLKALLTAVTSPALAVHSQALLLAVRACYNVFLTSRSEVNQTTAKATLTQMLNVVFQRMEAGSASVLVPPLHVSDVLGLPPADASSMSAFVQQFLHDVAISVDVLGYHAAEVQQGLDDAFVHSAHDAQADQVSASSTASSQRGQQLPTVMMKTDGTTRMQHEQQQMTGDAGLDAQQQLDKDAFLVFRALCKLSIRSNDGGPSSELTTVRGKVLALELLKILLENSGPRFARGERFMGAIRQNLCLSLLKNCASSVPALSRLCCSIFLTLVAKFRRHLKAEVGVFFPMILLRPIEPAGGAGHTTSLPAVDTAYKAVVLRCLQAQCEDGQLLVDLFVNYDCDLEGANMFERAVTALVRIAQGTAPHDATAQTVLEGAALRYEALRCLVSILRSLVAWHVNSVNAAAAAAAATAAQAQVAAAVAGEEVLEDSLRSGWMERMASRGAMPEAAAGGSGADAEQQRQAAMLESFKAYKRQVQEGVRLFNQKPRKGVAYLLEQGLVEGSGGPDKVAAFLARTPGLNKTLIGDYLGERDDFCIRVMHAYVDALEFEGMQFDEAIRKFLSGFRLPGEAQKIDRLMEKFAERYVACNPEAFKSADVAYVLAYSVIMLNTDAHNPMVKTKMSRTDFLRNNRGINDGGDLSQEFMEALYDRIVSNEIKMRDDSLLAPGADAMAQKQVSAVGWLDTIMAMLPGRQQQAAAEPNDEAIRRTHDALRERAKGATFVEAHDGEAVRSMLDVAWAPMLGAFSVLFEEQDDEYFVDQCLDGFVAMARLASTLEVAMLRNTFVSSLARFTMLRSPGAMRPKHARAFRALLLVAEQNGNHLHESWQEVLRCVSRFELLQQATAGVPTDALLFAMPADKGAPGDKLKRRLLRQGWPEDRSEGLHDSVSSSITDMGLHAVAGGLPLPGVMAAVDAQELNRLFVGSAQLDSDAVVEFVRTLCSVATEELRPMHAPRVFSLAKIVEIAHFNMDRIRLVWGRIWAVLSDFFVSVGCHVNLSVAMYAVDSLRQLAMKFLERDELSNFTFQNDFLRPFVVVMRHSRAPEIRELIIRCASQMVLARASNIKSGWKSMFMVFTTAASDESPQIVRLAFDTIEKIVREHFHYITETETTTFTDCVNCLIAFTNNPHSLDVSLNAIAFLRFCALELAEGDIGTLEAPAEGAHPALNPDKYRIRPAASMATAEATATAVALPSLGSPRRQQQQQQQAVAAVSAGRGTRIRFTDRDEHMYFWFPLLAGLSELTFDPRPDIRTSSLEVLFDILRFHGASFTPPFWLRVFDSVLLPIFDHVRAEVTDTTTFTDEARRAEVDSWLYETCTRTLQHIVDIMALYYGALHGTPVLARLLDLLLGFVRRSHLALAGVGVAAIVRLLVSAGPQLDEATWTEVMSAFSRAAGDTLPDVSALIQHRMAQRTSSAPGDSLAGGGVSAGSPTADRRWSLGTGAGARRLVEVRVRASIQLLIVQACGEVYRQLSHAMPPAAAVLLVDTLRGVASHAAAVDADVSLRHSLLLAQAADGVAQDRTLPDPPLMRLEAEASQSYLACLLHILAAAPEATKRACAVEQRLVQLCLRNLERFEQQEVAAEGEEASNGNSAAGGGVPAASLREETAALAPLAVATLRALMQFSPQTFRAHLRDFFPLLTALISCDYAPPDVQRVLSELFSTRIGPLLQT